MHCKKAIVLILASLTASAEPTTRSPRFSGASALEFTRQAVAFGPRPVDSAAHKKLQAYILLKLKTFGCPVEQDTFTAQTPIGAKPMNNIIAKIPGQSKQIVVLTGHYDTKLMTNRVFVGANDAGSSTGFLLEMARVLCNKPAKNDILLVWLDGEEAMENWAPNDSLYGSRHLSARWKEDGTLGRVKAVINLDMIGDVDLAVVHEWNSTPWLRKLVWDTAAGLGYSRHFSTLDGAIEDDHIPFLRAGAPALDLIDFEYGPQNSWWHTEQDTVDKLSPQSFQVIGNVLLKVLSKLEN
ncbi:MAG TPA: M28 family peptidase [Bryobacteraceae bacterium]|nr:M28 family peptidase [Bryobacteraceae bacterium]